MPISWLTNYWSQVGKLVLPYLKFRKLGLEQMFGEKIIFRQHDENKNWIYIKNQSDLNYWTQKHLYSIHTRQLSDKNELLFVMDLDKRNDQMPFELVIYATQKMAEILDSQKQKYLLKFSGNRGFHFVWSLGKIPAKDLTSGRIYQKEHEMIESFTATLENNIRDDQKTNKLFQKYYPSASPYFSTNSVDQKTSHCILIDKNILKKNALIRSPWSIHPKTGLVAIPLKSKDLPDLDFNQFTPENVIKEFT